jgi:hypothetical protein
MWRYGSCQPNEVHSSEMQGKEKLEVVQNIEKVGKNVGQDKRG